MIPAPQFHPAPPEGCIETEQIGHVLLIGINRPAKLNGWTPQMFSQLASAYTRLDDDEQLRVGVVHAAGEHFTAGLDLPSVSAQMEQGQPLFPPGGVDPYDLGERGYRRRVKPVIAAVKGICFTVGIELMLAADVVIAGEVCRFKQMEVQRGLLAGGGATMRMPQRAGLGNALLWLLTGDEFDAATALRLNFVQKIVPNALVLAQAFMLAQRIAEQAPLAVIATRQNARIAVEQGLNAAVEALPGVQKRIFASQDWEEGVRSFKEKRAARFTGR